MLKREKGKLAKSLSQENIKEAVKRRIAPGPPIESTNMRYKERIPKGA